MTTLVGDTAPTAPTGQILGGRLSVTEDDEPCKALPSRRTADPPLGAALSAVLDVVQGTQAESDRSSQLIPRWVTRAWFPESVRVDCGCHNLSAVPVR